MVQRESTDNIKFYSRGLSVDELVAEIDFIRQITSNPPEHEECEIRCIDADHRDRLEVTETKPNYGSDGNYIILLRYTCIKEGTSLRRVG
ncbi:hypothetical protein J4476_05620 [Candidatus Woesearchaeota archaeon]|nr:MAG: hypothetical protein QT09_C0003G0046 [archaeon GW2011_AR18]MBS3162144.1 hypothetical protein [Candidatus Woesearchaeota archaeon]HIH26262.1 hypothetical protein [Nanoarchaeota archaeon]